MSFRDPIPRPFGSTTSTPRSKGGGGWGCVGLLLAVPMIAALGVTLRAWVVWKMWRWFAVPLGAPRVGMWHLAGIALMFWIVTSEHWMEDRKSERSNNPWGSAGKLAIRISIGPLIALLFAYIYLQLAGLS